MKQVSDFVNKIICGNSIDVLAEIPDESIQCCITSPPYWGPRDYGTDPIIWGGDPECKHEWGSMIPHSKRDFRTPEQMRVASTLDTSGSNNVAFDNSKLPDHAGQFCSKCGGWRGQLGLEPQPELYISNLVTIFREVKRVLRRDGSCWVNISDSYAGSWGAHKEHHVTQGGYSTGKGAPVYGKEAGWCPQATPYKYGLKPKDMVLIPFRLALALQQDGWWIRSNIIWHKPNCNPESVSDRPTRDFEHVFLLAKSKKYFYDQNIIREPHLTHDPRNVSDRQQNYRGKFDKDICETVSSPRARQSREGYEPSYYHPLGRNKRTTWKVENPVYQLRGDLTAADRHYVLAELERRDLL